MSNKLYSAGEPGCVWLFAYDTDTFDQTEFNEMALKRPCANFMEDSSALKQLLHDEFGSPETDGEIFEVVPVPDDVAESRPAPGCMIVLWPEGFDE